MCSNCAKILIDFSIKHTPEACPLKASLMCTYCNKRGHSNMNCSIAKKKQMGGVRPIVSEQRTHMFPPTLNIRPEDASLGAFLRSNGVLPCMKEDPVARLKKNNELVADCAKKYGVVVGPYRISSKKTSL